MARRPLRAAALHGRRQRLLRLRPAARGRLEPLQRGGLRRPRGDRPAGRMDPGRGGPGRELRGLRGHDERQGLRPVRLPAGQREQRVPGADPRPAERVQHLELVRPDRRRPGQQRRHSVDLAGRAAPRRPAAGTGAVGQLHGRRGVRHRLVHADGRLLPHRRVRPHRDHEQLLPDRRRGRGPGGRGVRRRGERQELPVLHQRLRHLLAGRRRRHHLHAARAAREHHRQRRLQPHRYPGRRQRQGPARRPAARGVRLRAAAHPRERRRHAAPRTGQPARPRQLLQRLVRLRQRPRRDLRRPPGGLAQGFFAGRPIVDLEVGFPLGEGATLAVGGRNLFDVYSQVSAIAMSVGEQYSEYTPWGYSGADYYLRIGYGWGN